ncbi:Fur family transcriptional regulator [Chloroflexota bacterium]
MEQSGNISSKLRKMGYRLTPQRMIVASAIENSDDHISAEEIYGEVRAKYPRVNISTVYRTLELLTKLGLLYEIDQGEGRIGYHPEARGHHHHLICKNCGAIIDVGESVLFPVEAVLLQAFHFKPDLRHVAIFGFCEKCQQ